MNKIKVYLIITILILAGSVIAVASSTQIWELNNGEQLLEGELKGVIISDEGEIVAGWNYEQLTPEKSIDSLWSALTLGNKIYLGTGNKGEIYSWEKTPGFKKLGTTDLVAVTDIENGERDFIFAAGIPGGKIYKVWINKAPSKAIETFATLNVDNIWDLLYLPQNKVLYAATGSKGEIYSIDINGKSQLYYKAPESNVISLSTDKNGTIWAGTSPHAYVIEIKGPGKGRTIASFDSENNLNEAKKIQWNKGNLYVIVNKFKEAKVSTSISITTTSVDSKKTTEIKRPDPIEGSLYKLNLEGQVELIETYSKNYFLNLHIYQNEACISSGVKGRIFCIDSRFKQTLKVEVPSRQIIDFSFDKLSYAIASDPASLYILDNNVPQLSSYITPVLDAQFPTKWGKIEIKGQGSLGLEFRSGNTKQPDESWSDWQKANNNDLVKSPAARFLQCKVSLNDTKSVLKSIKVFYRNFNQRAIIKSIDYTKTSSETGSKTSDKTPDQSSLFVLKSNPIIKLSWKLQNPDDDPLRHQLWYKEINEPIWKRITREDQFLIENNFNWDIRSVPSGYYLVKVVSTDELNNTGINIKESEKISEPILIDNLQPEFVELTIKGTRVTGKVRDNFSPVLRIDYTIDSQEWLPVEPVDYIFDSVEESFDFPIPSNLTAGPHTFAIRAYDLAGNMVSKQISFTKNIR